MSLVHLSLTSLTGEQLTTRCKMLNSNHRPLCGNLRPLCGNHSQVTNDDDVLLQVMNDDSLLQEMCDDICFTNILDGLLERDAHPPSINIVHCEPRLQSPRKKFSRKCKDGKLQAM